jgi:hypothetical protein
MSGAKANHDFHIPSPEGDAQREHPTIQCGFFFIEPGKEGAVVVFLAVDVWSRYVTVVPLKQRNIQTVGQALVKFINHVRDGTVEIALDNEPVLVAGVAFCEAARAKTGYTTIATPKQMYDKGRTGVAERFVQTIRGLQKTLLCQHVVVQWAAMHALWSYNKHNVHSRLKVTPFQCLGGWPYKGKVVSFGQTVYGLDPKATKYKPAWRCGAWLGKDIADHDLISTDGQCIIRTKAGRKIPANGMQNYLLE